MNYLDRGRQPFNTNSLAQVAAIAALDDQEHVRNTVELNRREMTRVVPELERRGLSVTPSQANFVLADAGRDGQALFNALLRAGVIVRPMTGYGLPTSIRITLGTEAMNNALLRALDEVL